MPPEPPAPPVHSWDTERRRVRCGATHDVRSTKYDARVTCPECLRLLAAGRTPAAAPAEHA